MGVLQELEPMLNHLSTKASPDQRAVLDFTSKTGKLFLTQLCDTVVSIVTLSEKFWVNPDTIYFFSCILAKAAFTSSSWSLLPNYADLKPYLKGCKYGFKVVKQRKPPMYVVCSYLVGYIMMETARTI